MIRHIFIDFHAELFPQVIVGYKYVFALILFGYLTHYLPDSWQESIITLLRRGNILVDAAIITAVIYIVIQIKSSDIQPFIYFQF